MKELLDSTNEETLLFEENYQLEFTKELFRVNLNLLTLRNFRKLSGILIH